MKGIVNFLPLAAFLGLLWVLFVRPSRARQQKALSLRQSVVAGQRIITTSGLHATVVAVTEDTVDIETSPGAISTWEIGAVGHVIDGADAAPVQLSSTRDHQREPDADAERSS